MKNSFIFFFLINTAFVFGQSASKDICVIQNKTGVSKGKLKEIQSIYQGKYSRWPATGESVIIVLPSSKNPSSVAAARIIYKSSVKEMQKFWLALVFQGRAAPPVFLETDADIIQYVIKNPGAIGIISASSRKGVENEYLFQFVE